MTGRAFKSEVRSQNAEVNTDLTSLHSSFCILTSDFCTGCAGMECAAAAAYGFMAVWCFFDGALYSYGGGAGGPPGVVAFSPPFQVELPGAPSPLTKTLKRRDNTASGGLSGTNFYA